MFHPIIVVLPPNPSVEKARKEEGDPPQSKPNRPGLPPRNAEGVVGGIRAWGENPAAEPARCDCTPIAPVWTRGARKFPGALPRLGMTGDALAS
jgi:hypothetical protein